MKVRKLLGYIVFILLAAAAVFGLNYFFSTRETITYTRPLKSVTVTEPVRGDAGSTIVLTGYIESETTVPVISMVGGTVTSVLFEEGDKVEKDELLATTDRRIYEAQAAQAEAQYKVAESTYRRLLSLMDADAVSAQELEGAAAQFEAASAQKELATLQLSYTFITAPAKGTILQRNISPGSTASPENPVAVIADLDDLTLSLSIPYAYYPDITKADDISFIVSENISGSSSSATLVSISPYIDASTRSFRVKLKIDDPASFRPGMYVSVSLAYDIRKDVLLLPQSIRRSDGSAYAVKDGKAVYIPSSELQDEDSEYFIVPPEYGEMLFISDGQNSVLDNEMVNIQGGSR